MPIRKSDIVQILQGLTRQDCEYMLLRPYDIISNPDTYNDIDIVVSNDKMADFIQHLAVRVNAMGGHIETKPVGLFSTTVSIIDKEVITEIDIENKITWRGLSIFDHAHLIKTASNRDGIIFVDRKFGDIIIFTKELFKSGNLQRKPQWWIDFAKRVQLHPDAYEELLKNHVFMFSTKRLIGKLKRGDSAWIEQRRWMYALLFSITKISNNPNTELFNFFRWLGRRVLRWSYK